MKLPAVVFCFFAVTAQVFAAEDLRGGILMVFPENQTLYGSARDFNNLTNNTFQVKICWDDPAFVSNCDLIRANTIENPYSTCSGTSCVGFNYLPPDGVVGSVTPRDGKRHLMYVKVLSQQNPGAGDRVLEGSPWPFSYTKGAVTQMWPANPEPQPSRLSASQVAVVANASDPYSVGSTGNIVCAVGGKPVRDDGVAGYFVKKHNVPCNNVSVVSLPVQPSISQNTFESVIFPELQRLPSSIQAIALAWVQPSTVTPSSAGFYSQAISAVTANAGMVTGTACINQGTSYLGAGPVSPYFNSVSRAPFSDYGIRPTMMLAGEVCPTCTAADNYSHPWIADFNAAKATIDAAVAAVDTNPLGGNVIWAWTSDLLRSQSAIVVSPLVLGSGLSPKVNASVLGTKTVPFGKTVSAQNILLYDQSAPNWNYSSPGFLPGAGVGFSVTSTSGRLPSDGNQTPVVSWLSQGAVAAYGNAVEPCDLLVYKDPDPAVLIPHYVQGQTIVEALWKSVRLPWGGNFVGDPLASPFSLDSGTAFPGQISLSSALNSASFAPGALAPGSISSLFGASLSNLTALATLPLPSFLAGANVNLTDSSGSVFPAQLFFASPSQLNFLVPPGLKSGPGTLSVDVAGVTGMLPVRIASTHPGLFAANGSGAGAAVGNVLHVAPNGDTSYTPMVACSGVPFTCAPMPIHFNVPGERIYLILYGTGIRNVSSISAVTVSIGALKANVLFAGAQGTLQGLDQVNIEIPASLAGTGTNQIQLSVNGELANPLDIVIE